MSSIAGEQAADDARRTSMHAVVQYIALVLLVLVAAVDLGVSRLCDLVRPNMLSEMPDTNSATVGGLLLENVLLRICIALTRAQMVLERVAGVDLEDEFDEDSGDVADDRPAHEP